MFHQDEPFPTASIYAQYCVMEEAKKQGVVVLLDGQGADEILAGYEYYLTYYLQELKTNDTELFYKELDAMKSVHPHIAFNEELAYELKGEATTAESSLTDKFKDIVRPLYKKVNPGKYDRLAQKLPLGDNYDPTFFDKIKDTKQYDFNVRKNSLNEYLKFSVETNNLEDLLRFSDRNSMAHSREVRLPFLSTDLVEFLFALPASFKVKNAWTKSLLRDAMHDIIPPEIEKRVDKIGYEPPQKKWMENSLLKEQIRTSYQKLKDERILSGRAIGEGKKDWQVLNIASLMQQN
jgi:asparagine synthase (glutamine-hydrolysing)